MLSKKNLSFFFFLTTIALLVVFAIPALAAPGSLRISGDTFPDFTFQIPFSSAMTSIDGQEIVNGTAIATYIGIVYEWAVAFAAVLAVLAFTFAGVLWLIAGGDAGKVTESKKIMGNAIIGLVLALGSYTLLWTIKPELVQFSPIAVTPINGISVNLSPTVVISTGGTLVRSSCSGPKKEGARCSADNPCECESGVCTPGGVCGGLKVKEPEKLAKQKGLCCYVIDNAGSKSRRQRNANNSKACLYMILATDHVSMKVDRFFCPEITGVTVPHCWKKDAGSGTDPGYYQRSTSLCKTYIDFNSETDTSGGTPTRPPAEPNKSGLPVPN